MWRKIRAPLILKKIFNNINTKRKLIINVYNKELQKKLGLDIIDFWIFSGRYKVKKYDETIIYNSLNNIILFEGKYENNKKNGKGKEYKEYKGEVKLIFEGEYLDGKKWEGKYFEYDEDSGKLIFECKYLKGIMNGEAKEYDKYNGQLLFSGKYLNGKRNGKGTEYKSLLISDNNFYSSRNIKYQNIKIFSGEYFNGERKEGKEYNYDGE